MSQELMMQVGANLAGLLVGGAAVYGGIRADMRHAIRAIEEAHRRIDAMMIRAGGLK